MIRRNTCDCSRRRNPLSEDLKKEYEDYDIYTTQGGGYAIWDDLQDGYIFIEKPEGYRGSFVPEEWGTILAFKRKTRKNPPPGSGYPKGLVKMWTDIYENAYREYKDKSIAASTAWSQVKRKYKKNEKTGKWQLKVNKSKTPAKKSKKKSSKRRK